MDGANNLKDLLLIGWIVGVVLICLLFLAWDSRRRRRRRHHSESRTVIIRH
jgi:hypothetical protein